MKNIIKSQLYQYSKNSIVWIVFAGCLLLPVANIFMEGHLTRGGDYPTETCLFENGMFYVLTSLMFLFTFAGFACCGDFTDKTTNYELMAGHRRIEVYFGRVIPCLVTGTICFAVMVFCPLVVNTALHGWGTRLDAGQMILRYALLIFPAIRILCTSVFVAFIVKKPLAMAALGYAAFMTCGICYTAFDMGDTVALGITNINMLCTFESWSTYGLGSRMHYAFDASISAGEIVGTIVASLAAGALFLYLGYVFFRRDDLN